MKLPAFVHSLLGPVPVVVTAMENERDESMRKSLGFFDPRERRVQLDAASQAVVSTHCLFHEGTHVALWDAGVFNMLSPEQNEAVADAIGTWLTSAVQSGWLKFGGKRG